MATLGDLVVKLSMDAAGFTSDAGRAAYAAEKSMARITAAGTLAAAGIAAITVALASAAKAAATALPGIADSVAEQVDALDEAAEAAGITSQAYQKLQLAMKEAGVSSEQFDAGMTKLSKSIVDAAEDADGKAAVAFQRLGISVKNADGSLKTVDQTIAELSARFKTLEAGPEKVAIAYELLGKSGAKWIPALNSDLVALGQQAEKVGAVFSNELTQSAQDYKQALAELSVAQQGLSNVIAEQLLAPMTEAIKVLGQFVAALTDAAGESEKITASGAKEFFRGLAIAVGFTIDVFATLRDLTATLVESFALLLFSAHQVAEGLNRVAALDFSAAKQSLRNIDAAIDEFRENAQARLNREPLRVKLEAQFAAADAAQAQRQAEAALRRTAPDFGGKPLGAAPPPAAKKGKQGKSETERELEAASKRLDALAKRNAEEGVRIQQKASQESLEAFLDGLTEQAKAEERLAELSEKNAQEAVQMQRRKSEEELAIFLDAQEQKKQAFQQVEDIFSNALGDTLADMATGAKSVGDAFRDMAQQIGQAMVRIAAQKVATGFMDWLLKDSGGNASSSGISGILAGVVGAFAGGKQHGGIFMGNRMFRVGENGPEMIHSAVGGRVEPIDNKSETHNNISVNVNVPPSTDRRTADQVAAAAGLAVSRAMRRIQ